MRLEHVNLTVGDLERSIRFYSELLGWKVRWQGTTSSGMPAAHVGTDDTYLALFEGGAKTIVWDYEHVGFNHVGFVVDDIEATKVRLEELGATVHADQEYEPGRRLYASDPDGYEIEVVSYAE